MTHATNKTLPTAVSPRAFIESVEHPQRKADGLFLLDWFARVTGCPAIMWGPSLIGFGRYHYEYASGRQGDFLMTGFSPRKASLSIYILPGYQDQTHHLSRLGKHKHGKSCLYVNKLSDIDLDILEAMVKDGIESLRGQYPTWAQ